MRQLCYLYGDMPAARRTRLSLRDDGDAEVVVPSPDGCAETVVTIRRQDVAAVLTALERADVPDDWLALCKASAH